MPQAQLARSSAKKGTTTPPPSWSNNVNMNNFSYLIGSQIRHLIMNLKPKNMKASVAELHQLIDLYGTDAYLYLLRSLVASIDFKDQKNPKMELQLRIQLLAQELTNLQKQPNFASLVCQALEGVESISEDFLIQMAKILKLEKSQEILLGLGLAHSVDANVKQEAIKFLRSKVSDLIPSSLKNVPENILHSFLYFARMNEGFSKQIQTCMKAIQKNNPVAMSFSPLISEGDNNIVNSKQVYVKEPVKSDSFSAELSRIAHVSSVLEDLGYASCESQQSLKEVLSDFPEMKELDVAMIIGMMARSHTGLESVIPFAADFPTNIFDGKDQSSNAKTWNIVNFVEVMKELYPKLNWVSVMKHLDHPAFVLTDSKGLVLIMNIFKKATKESFPVEMLFDNWKNTTGQLSFLKFALSAPPDLFNFANSSSARIEADGLPSVGKTMNQSWYSLSVIDTLLRLADSENYVVVRNLFNYPIKHCPELLILGLAQVKPVFNMLHSELCALLIPNILLSNSPNANFVIHKLWALNPAMLVRGMIEQWNKDPLSLTRVLEIATQDLKALPQILDARPFLFSIDLAALASRREFLLLEKWVQDKVVEHGGPFVKALLSYIKDKLPKSPKDPGQIKLYETLQVLFTCLQSNTTILSPDLVEEIKVLAPKFKAEENPSPNYGGVGIQQLEGTQQDPKFIPSNIGNTQKPIGNPNANPTPGTPGPQNAQSESRVFSQEVEEAANAYFQKIYTGQMSLDDIISLLKKFKASTVQREQDVFACMIHNLFDEYRFFPKYPDKELQITGILFGSLIQHQLVSFLPLGVALRYVLDALRKQPGSKMFKFGLTALEQFKSRLAEWPQYCSHILAITHIRRNHPEIIDFIERTKGSAPTPPPTSQPVVAAPVGIPNTAPPNESSSQPPTPSNVNANPPVQSKPRPSSPPPVKTAISPPTPDPKLEVKANPPPPDKPKEDQEPILEALFKKFISGLKLDENTLDKMSFIFNNVSQMNLDQKVLEMRELIKEEDYQKYLAYYIVLKRVSQEQNFHQLYLMFLERLRSPKVFSNMLTSCLGGVKALLDSERLTSSIPERTLLKNLGSWLGSITLSRNKPLLQKDLALKELIFQAYEQGRLIAVIPFVCKILEPAAVSFVFKPPNPWVMAIVRLLSEVYRKRNLRLNLKFEIELLCRILQLDINDTKPTDLLKDHKQYTGPNNFDFNPPPEPEEVKQPPPPQPPTHIEPEEQSVLGPYLVIQSNIPLFAQQPQLQRLVPRAIDRAIREIIQPVVERSVTIACITTRELITKDFVSEPEEAKMRKAAHLMVQNLAGSLALVTCKEPLRLSMSNHLRSQLMAQTTEALQNLVEQAVQVISTDNLDLACTFIERAATEKAVRDTDEILAKRKHRYMDPVYLNQIPENLRPKFGGLLPHQLRVYDDFARIPHVQAPSQQEGSGDDSASGRGAFAENEGLTTQQALEKLNTVISELAQAVARHQMAPSLSNLPQDHDIYSFIKQIPSLLMIINSARPDIELALAQKAFNSLFENDNQMYLDVQIAILDSITEVTKKLNREVTNWVLISPDDRKLNKRVIPALIRTGLLIIQDFDAHMARLIDNGRNKMAFEFSVFLVKTCILDAKILPITDFKETFDVLTRISRTMKGSEELAKLLEETSKMPIQNRLTQAPPTTKSVSPRPQVAPEPAGLREKVLSLFDGWFVLFSQPNQSEKALANYVLQNPLFHDEDSSNRFFKICVEYCIENSVILDRNTANPSAYKHIDAFTKLVVVMIKQADPTHKTALLGRILGILVRVLIADYDSKSVKFNQRPFFRLFANLLTDLNAPDPTLDPINLQILLTFSNAFLMLQPSVLTGFSFAWLDLISHRMFMPKLLLSKQQKGWPIFQTLLVELFKFLEPHLRNAELSESIRYMYKGTLRVLLVLLHDFPEFLCDYHFSFCDVIPASCIQMRNLILSAFPRNMRLPDPFTPNLKVDLLPEINQSPVIRSDFTAILNNTGLKKDIDSYLKTRQPVSFLLELKSKLLLDANSSSGTKYNIPLINSLVLYVGAQAISQLQNKAQNSPITHSAPMDIFQHLSIDLDTEGRYLFLNAIGNQLRYPNNHTHYFSCVLLFLFAEANSEITQEQITRVLLERLIVNRPHPWGLLITFIELIKNPRYNFWSHSFTRVAPEIERLFESVARSCMTPNTPPKSGDEGQIVL